MGYDGSRYILPKLTMMQHTVRTGVMEGYLFAVEAKSLKERQQARRDSVNDRAAKCAELVNGDSDQWLVWCNLNDEADALKKLILEAVEVRGSDKPEVKEQAAIDFAAGNIRVLISKPLIVHIITADTEGAVVDNIQRKERQFNEMLHGMIVVTQDITKAAIHYTVDEYLQIAKVSRRDLNKKLDELPARIDEAKRAAVVP